jgi:hypothetical protein
VASVLLFVGTAVLLFRGPRFTTEDDGEGAVSVRCGSALAVGWPSDAAYLDDEDRSSWSDHVLSDRPLSAAGRRGLARECAERRDTYLALAVAAAAAANLAAAAALTRRRTAA